MWGDFFRRQVMAGKDGKVMVFVSFDPDERLLLGYSYYLSLLVKGFEYKLVFRLCFGFFVLWTLSIGP